MAPGSGKEAHGADGEGGAGMKQYEVYRGNDTDLVDVIYARTYEEACRKARKKGYGKGFRVVEVRDA
jgi:hypothetical protein